MKELNVYALVILKRFRVVSMSSHLSMFSFITVFEHHLFISLGSC